MSALVATRVAARGKRRTSFMLRMPWKSFFSAVWLSWLARMSATMCSTVRTPAPGMLAGSSISGYDAAWMRTSLSFRMQASPMWTRTRTCRAALSRPGNSAGRGGAALRYGVASCRARAVRPAQRESGARAACAVATFVAALLPHTHAYG